MLFCENAKDQEQDRASAAAAKRFNVADNGSLDRPEVGNGGVGASYDNLAEKEAEEE